MIHTEPCSYWDKNVYTEVSSLLESLYQAHSSQLKIDEETFNYFQWDTMLLVKFQKLFVI